MKKQFCTYEISKELKELGFDEECFAIYFKGILNNGYSVNYISTDWKSLFYKNKINSESNSIDIVSAPLWQQAWSFLFKKLDFYYPYLRTEIFSDYSGKLYHPKDVGIDELEIDFDNKEQLILKLIELIKNKQLCKKELNITK